jgi:anti-anti-sigma factor
VGVGSSILQSGELGRGSHACWSYRSDGAHRDFLAAYFTAGIEANERLMYLAPPAQLRTAVTTLTEAGLEVGTLMAHGRLVMGDVTAAYLSAGALEPDIRLAGHALIVEQALRDGFDGLRVCSEIAPLLRTGGVRDDWYPYEVRADVLIASLASIVVCACDQRNVEPQVMSELAAVHSLRGGAVGYPSPFVLHAGPDGLALSGEVDASSADRIGRWLRDVLGDMSEPVVDVTELEFIDAAGMWALLDSAHTHPGGLVLRGTSPHFRRVWAVCGYDAIGSVQLN